MIFPSRSTQAEYLDAPELPADQRSNALRELDRLNTLFFFSHPFASRLPRWLGRDRCRHLEILDIGAGTGLLGRRLSAWARRRGWEWSFTNLDINPIVPVAGDPAKTVSASALALPFANDRFDLVIASQMTHHFTDREVVRHWQEAWRVSRDAVFICDVHRNIGLYAVLWLTMRLLRSSPAFFEDGLTSVKRGFRRGEWQEFARQAGILDARVSLYYGTRVVLQARKGGR